MFLSRGVVDDGREAEVSWFRLGSERVRARPKNGRGLVGDEHLIRRAIVDEMDGRSFGATPTPSFRADVDNPEAALVQLTSYFCPRSDGLTITSVRSGALLSASRNRLSTCRSAGVNEKPMIAILSARSTAPNALLHMRLNVGAARDLFGGSATVHGEPTSASRAAKDPG